MSCGGGHLEFPIDKKTPQNFVEVYPLIILTKLQFNWSSGFRGVLTISVFHEWGVLGMTAIATPRLHICQVSHTGSREPLVIIS
jgi:hypothetical protein